MDCNNKDVYDSYDDYQEPHELLLNDLTCQTFHCSDEEAVGIVNDFVDKHSEILEFYDIEFLYSI